MMYSGFLERTKASIEALKKHLVTSEAMRGLIQESKTNDTLQPAHFFTDFVANAPERVEWRIIDHCVAVTRIYAIYEQFAHEMLREHVSLLQRHLKFNELSIELQGTYRRGLATILEKKDGPRYGQLNLERLIEQYGNALAGQSYELEPLALLIQDQNLRLPELNKLFTGCGIPRTEGWIETHQRIREFFDDTSRLTNTAEHELRELIQFRNDAAHGSISIDDVAGLGVLIEFCNFIETLCEVLAERVQLAGIDALLEKGGALVLGRADQTYKSGMILVAMITGQIKVGDTIFLSGENYCNERRVLSLQLDGKSIENFDSAVAVELGIGLDLLGRKNCRITSILPLTLANEGSSAQEVVSAVDVKVLAEEKNGNAPS